MAMDQTLSLGWMEAQAQKRRSVYRNALGLNLLLQVAIGLFALLAGGTLAQMMGLNPATDTQLLRAWGALLILISVLQVPGYVDPVRFRWSNVIGIPGRFATAMLYLLLGKSF